MVVEPEMMEVTLPAELLTTCFLDDLRNQPRAVQKERGRDTLRASGG